LIAPGNSFVRERKGRPGGEVGTMTRQHRMPGRGAEKGL